jgi:hypothetical protein
LSDICRQQEKTLDIQRIWGAQRLPQSLIDALALAARFVNDDIVNPQAGISNISEWCKKDLCWTRIQNRLVELKSELSEEFLSSLLSKEDGKIEEKSARKIQKIDNGIVCQKKCWSLGQKNGKRLQIMD